MYVVSEIFSLLYLVINGNDVIHKLYFLVPKSASILKN